MYNEDKIWIGQSGEEKVCIIPKMANRHGLIAGATGTGKTITLKVLAESFSDAGVPVFLADAKGDLAGMCRPGDDSENMQKRIQKFGLQDIWSYHAYPTALWDVYGEQGHPLRTTISEMGPMLLAKLMGLNDTQSDILSIVFRIADDAGLLLIDIKDLRSMLTYVGEHTADYVTKYGNMTKQSIGAIVRTLINLEEQGGNFFFGEPALDIRDWFRTDENARGYINILAADKLMNYPEMYGTFMLWMMSELFEILPEAGDAEKPEMVFFFDEAHMLFDSASRELLQKIEQVVKLIRSKGVGIYFITQSPSDIPDEILGQLGNRIQHALRAYTPAEQKALKAAAGSFRENPDFKTIDVLPILGVGEALISVLDEEGRPGIVKQCKVLCPQSRMGAVTEEERRSVIAGDVMASKYDESIDRDSAYEFLSRKAAEEQKEKAEAETAKEKAKAEAAAAKEKAKAEAAARKEEERRERERERARREMMRGVSKVATSVGTQLVRGILKNLTK
ncbi:MAG: DUF853 family protein [Eubacteriales bacterium]|nr:DUF853 family protein [Eubacteriales bacterium]